MSNVAIFVQEESQKKDRNHFWQQHSDNWELSGLTQQKYCEVHGLNYNTFKNWRHQLKPIIVDQIEDSTAPVLTGGDVTIHLTNGTRIEVGISQLPEVLKALK